MSKRNLGQKTSSLFKKVSKAGKNSKQAIANLFAGPTHPALKKLSEKEQDAFWTVLWLVAIADGSIDDPEQNHLKSLIQDDQSFINLRQLFENSSGDRPQLNDQLETLQNISAELQWKLLFWSLELALIDRQFHGKEKTVIAEIRSVFDISDEQFEVVLNLVNLLQFMTEKSFSTEEIQQKFGEIQAKAQKLDIILDQDFYNLANQNFSDYQSYYSEKKFNKKLKKYALTAGEKTVETALILFYTWQRPDLPLRYKTIIAGALGYWIFPPDLLPDLIPVVGYSDDLSALAMSVLVVTSYINEDVKIKARTKLNKWFGKTSENKSLPSGDGDVPGL